jgi:hypothetical protein
VDKQLMKDKRSLSFAIFIFSILLSSGLASAQCGDCDDNNPCTMDLCESMTCQHIPQECGNDKPPANGSAPQSPVVPDQNPQAPPSNKEPIQPESCDDNNPCTSDSYGASGCVHDPVNCDDGNASILDSCGPSGCVNTPLPAGSTMVELAPSSGSMKPEIKDEVIDENTTANESQSTAEGPETLPICDDENPCTKDAYDGKDCVFAPLNCDDGNDSTEDSCIDGTCINKPIDGADTTIAFSENNGTNLLASQSLMAAHRPPNCDDGDPCTVDSYNGKECEHKPKVCDDGDPNTNDYCYNGVCYNTTKNCDDGNPCTVDSFNGVSCVNTSMNCDDHNACTIDTCKDGKCVHTPKNAMAGIRAPQSDAIPGPGAVSAPGSAMTAIPVQ